jgi:hypothetical protein
MGIGQSLASAQTLCRFPSVLGSHVLQLGPQPSGAERPPGWRCAATRGFELNDKVWSPHGSRGQRTLHMNTNVPLVLLLLPQLVSDLDRPFCHS